MLIQGSRQVGKSSFLTEYAPDHPPLAELDDLARCTRAEQDPALFFSQFPPPVIVDEFQYAPNLLPEVKRTIDQRRRKRRTGALESNSAHDPLFYLSGSNQIEIDRAIKETLLSYTPTLWRDFLLREIRSQH